MLIYLNGEYLDRARASISLDDRGFIFGDGVYEVIRAADGGFFEPARHMRRLDLGLRALDIVLPDLGLDDLVEVAERLLSENDLGGGDATVYIQITRGAAPRTHAFPAAGTRPTVFLRTARYNPEPERFAHGVSAITHPDIRWARCDLKTINLLPNVLVQQRAVESGVEEAIFVRDGAMTEGTHANAFAVIDGEIRTYPASNYILPGVTREVVIELARELGMPLREAPVFSHELLRASEVFLTGTTSDVLPIIVLDGRSVGDGRPGPNTRRLQTALGERRRLGSSQSVARV